MKNFRGVELFMELKFLGTGGGRFVTGMQKRKTGGIILETEETQLHIDPGPGALVEAHENANPEETEAMIVSHAHLDHANDAEAVIEMMVEAYDQAGTVFTNETALEGYSDIEKKISNYHQNLCGQVKLLEEGSEHEFEDLRIESQQMFHSDPKTAGFTISNGEKKIGFWTDTEFSKELLDLYEGCDTLVVYCSRPRDAPIESHTSLDDVPDMMGEISPSTVIVTHFGYKFLEQDLEEQKNWLDGEIDAKVVFAEDGMKFPGNRTLDAF